jgi:hypothetical protein
MAARVLSSGKLDERFRIPRERNRIYTLLLLFFSAEIFFHVMIIHFSVKRMTIIIA